MRLVCVVTTLCSTHCVHTFTYKWISGKWREVSKTLFEMMQKKLAEIAFGVIVWTEIR